MKRLHIMISKLVKAKPYTVTKNSLYYISPGADTKYNPPLCSSSPNATQPGPMSLTHPQHSPLRHSFIWGIFLWVKLWRSSTIQSGMFTSWARYLRGRLEHFVFLSEIRFTNLGWERHKWHSPKNCFTQNSLWSTFLLTSPFLCLVSARAGIVPTHPNIY